jgi:hypothetical protein
MTVGDILGPETAIPIALLTPLVIGAVTVTIWLVRSIGKLESRLDALVTSKAFYSWVYKLQRLNPDIKMPEDFP